MATGPHNCELSEGEDAEDDDRDWPGMIRNHKGKWIAVVQDQLTGALLTGAALRHALRDDHEKDFFTRHNDETLSPIPRRCKPRSSKVKPTGSNLAGVSRRPEPDPAEQARVAAYYAANAPSSEMTISKWRELHPNAPLRGSRIKCPPTDAELAAPTMLCSKCTKFRMRAAYGSLTHTCTACKLNLQATARRKAMAKAVNGA